jgi:hypothetical protein
VIQTYNPSYGDRGKRISSLSPAREKLGRSYLKNNQKQNINKRAGSVAQMIEHFIAYIAMDSFPST